MWEVRKIQNQDIIMRKVGKWFIIIGIAGVLSILFVEWSRWNIISLSKKLHSIILNENSYVFKANFIEGIIGTVSIFSLLLRKIHLLIIQQELMLDQLDITKVRKTL